MIEVTRKTCYADGTDTKVIDILEHARAVRTRLRFFFGNTDTGENWLEEYDVMGHIGRSTGSEPVPLLIKQQNSTGGGALTTDCILAIQLVSNKEWLYKHPKFKVPEFTITKEQYPFVCNSTNGETLARFKNNKEAENWIAFMRGERMRSY